MSFEILAVLRRENFVDSFEEGRHLPNGTIGWLFFKTSFNFGGKQKLTHVPRKRNKFVSVIVMSDYFEEEAIGGGGGDQDDDDVGDNDDGELKDDEEPEVESEE